MCLIVQIFFLSFIFLCPTVRTRTHKIKYIVNSYSICHVVSKHSPTSWETLALCELTALLQRIVRNNDHAGVIWSGQV